MRVSRIAISFGLLLLLGFLATPGTCKFVLPDYLLALNKYGGTLRELQEKIGNIDSKIPELQSNMARLASEAAQETDQNKKISLAAKSTLTSFDVEQLKTQKAVFEKLYSEIQTKLDNSATDSTNVSLVVRALALGAIGALFSIFAQFLAVKDGAIKFTGSIFSDRAWASMAMGAIVAVALVGLFYTGFISIFSGAEHSTGTPDFWKVTLLSLFAGAFADRLFQAATYRMDKYIGKLERAPVSNARKKR